MEATAAIPIVMTGASDPVAAGLMASLAHPGGNVTGIADYQVDLIPKHLELLKAAVPPVRRVMIAKALGLTVPQSLLLRAGEVIQ
jgi:putative ABC transport system substrate-binding protein